MASPAWRYTASTSPFFTWSPVAGLAQGFFFHDSHLFDGVDGRQVASALSFGKRIAEALGVQYIVTMISDIFDTLPLGPDLVRDEIVHPTVLSDATDTDGLFGFAFT